jgi:murein DD-endopeptidase MepM/ murein hydrolase activator NlpD
MTLRINGITLVGVAFILFTILAVFSDRSSSTSASSLVEQTPSAATEAATPPPDPSPTTDPAVIRYPYPDLTLTQGVHGESYGQMAIDIAAGKGATIYSPIAGTVTALYVDRYNNTTLIIENEVWQVLMLHGNYTVSVGQQVDLSQPVGSESNNGYTVDW